MICQRFFWTPHGPPVFGATLMENTMNVRQKTADAASSSTNPATIGARLRALAVRPHSQRVDDLIDRYMACYAGADTTRAQRLGAWHALIGDMIPEQ